MRLDNGYIIEPLEELEGSIYAYRLRKKVYISPAVYYLITDDLSIRDTIMRQVKIKPFSKVIDDLIDQELEKVI